MTSRLRPLRDEDQHIIAKEYAPRSFRGSFPVPGAQSTEAPTYCLKVNASWVGHVIGALMMMDQQDAWTDSSGAIEFARNEVRKLIASFEVCDDDSSGGEDDDMNCMPVGSIILWASDNIPDGWLVCDGQTLHLGGDYPELFSVIGDVFKPVVGYFRTPDMRFTTAIGVHNDDSLPAIPHAPLGSVSGEIYHQLTVAEMPGHSHQGYQAASSGGVSTSLLVDHNANRVDPVVFSGTTTSVGGNQPHSSMQPSLALYYIIRALPCESESETVMASFKLRQKPGNDCVLEQSLDGGTTWMEAFDYNACFGDMKDQVTNIESIVEEIKNIVEDLEVGQGDNNTYNYQNTYNNMTNYIQYLNNTYNNNVYNIYPQAEYDGSPEDEVRNDTLCVAIDMIGIWVKQIITTAIEEGDFEEGGFDPLKFIGDVAKFFTAVGAGAAVYTWWTGVGLAWGVAVSVVAGAVGAAAGFIDSITDFTIGGGTPEDIENYDLSEFICCLYDTMKDTTISQELFANSFASCAAGMVEESSAGKVIGEALIAIGQSPSTFLTFLDMLSKTFEGVKQGYLSSDCTCSDPICELQDFAADGMGDWVVLQGSYVVEQGVRGAGAPTYGFAQVERDLGMAFDIRQIDLDWYCPRNDDDQFYSIQAKVNAGDEWTELKRDDYQPTGRQVDYWTGSFIARYIRITAAGSFVNTRSGQIYAVNICYK